MNVLVVGLGSMGKRRIGLLTEFNVTIYGVDTNEERRVDVETKFGITTFASIKEAVESVHPTCSLICTSPIYHSKIITECLENDMNVFTEINLVSDDYEKNIALAKSKDLVLFLSSTFLYRPETEYIIDRVKKSEMPLNYIYHVGQYLPDWHPWESYKNFFVGDKRTNGCREIFAIELPWIVTAFGPVNNVSVVKGKNSSLSIDYDDNYLVQVEHANGTKGIFAVDIVSRKAVRRLEVFGEDLHLFWNGTPDSISEYDYENKEEKSIDLGIAEHKEGYASFITENPYREEIKTYLALVNGEIDSCKWDFERDLDALKLIDKIEE